MEQLVALLQHLSGAGQVLQAAADAEDTAAKLSAVKSVSLDSSHVAAARRVSGGTQGTLLWEQLASQHTSLADVSR
jgi:hypothetical protein